MEHPALSPFANPVPQRFAHVSGFTETPLHELPDWIERLDRIEARLSGDDFLAFKHLRAMAGEVASLKDEMHRLDRRMVADLNMRARKL